MMLSEGRKDPISPKMSSLRKRARWIAELSNQGIIGFKKGLEQGCGFIGSVPSSLISTRSHR